MRSLAKYLSKVINMIKATLNVVLILITNTLSAYLVVVFIN